MIKQMRKSSSILILIVSMAMAACFSFAATSLAQGSGGDIVSDVKTVLDEISDYAYGQSREQLSELRLLVQSSLDSQDARQRIEKEMITFLGSDATFAGKQFVCEQLSIIGTKESVPVLTELLSDEQTADIALYTLQRIPDNAADKALHESLAKVDREARIGIINTLGEREYKNAVGDLEKLVYDADPQTARSAATALGKIADKAADQALKKASSKTSGDLRGVVLDAYLLCADSLCMQDETSQAASIYRELYNEDELTRIQAAALRGLVVTGEEGAVDIILSALKRDNLKIQDVAVGLIRELPGTPDLKNIIAELPNFSEPAQVQLLAAFASRGETAARQAALDATKHQDENVRAAALSALAKIGNESDIPLLLQFAVSGEPTSNQEAARLSLAFLSGASVDQKIIAQIPGAEPTVKAELVRILGQRNVVEATEMLLTTAADPDEAVRRESLKSLAIVATSAHIDKLIQLVVDEENRRIRDEAERTVVLVSQKIEDTSSQAKPVLNVLSSVEDDEARGSLLEVLGRIGGADVLPVLRSELKSSNPEHQKAAIQALSVWPDTKPLDDLLSIVKTTDNEAHKILALRGYISLLRNRGRRWGRDSIAPYLTAMEYATEASEKRMILSGLGRIESTEVITVIAQYLDDPDIKAEAQAALRRPLGELRDTNAERTKRMLDGGLRETLNDILEKTDNPRLRNRVTEILEKGK